MPAFTALEASPETYFRSIILFGRNVASYKFALAAALLGLAAEGRSVVSLEELAGPFTDLLLEHLRTVDRQGTSESSKFLTACRAHLQGGLSREDLLLATVRLGFNNVIDAFHIVNQSEVPVRFFVDERRSRGGLLLTQELLALPEVRRVQYASLPQEVEARWRLVEHAWSLELPAAVLNIQVDSTLGQLFLVDRQRRRIDLTGVRDSLNGYQKGHCFYCQQEIGLAALDSSIQAEVDHFFPHVLKTRGSRLPVDGIWNLVLACQSCNRGESGKFARVPAPELIEKLHRRNSYLIQSHHPLRETLINQTGSSEAERLMFLRSIELEAVQHLVHRWRPAYVHTPVA
ncbi:HNH endonuclease domain-containing protein [Deinococcus rubellus]|uniref:HNH nuclease domain-containing protein n=1 Tax=Deinococcus rubellus TaxID=1889240 RepID=A0ABY5YIF1_9DEIO|nr:HNH endonuclease domain-containing protein [Deinococcus rubellus]UWX63921.1 hypothetical protein N0D28_14550 [Deinococcus rubellus]